MASEETKVSKQGIAGKRQHVILTPHKLEILQCLQLVKTEERLWLYTTLDCQLSMIQRTKGSFRASSESVKDHSK